MSLHNLRTQERAARHVAPIITCALALAAVVAFARPASAQASCGGFGFVLCGTVWDDLDGDGIQDAGEPGMGGVTVTVYDLYGKSVTDFYANPDGTYYFDSQTLPPGTYTVAIDIASIGTGVVASPTDVGGDDTVDSDGVDSTTGMSAYTVTLDSSTANDVDFGFFTTKVTQAGTGTPGYWKNHSEAWPVSSITIGGVTYSEEDAIALLAKPGKDKRATMFSSLLSAMLNVMIGNDSSCVQSTIDVANDWMAAWGVPNTDPIVTGSSAAWAVGEPLHKLMDAYNNGLLCAPHRN